MPDKNEYLGILTAWDQKRYARLVFDGTRYANCKYATAKNCRKHGRRKDCRACRTCPRCGGTLYVDHHEEMTAARTLQRCSVTTYICIHCGAWMERQFMLERKQETGKNQNTDAPPICAVDRCKHRTWSKQRITIQDEDFGVCDRHKRQYQRWLRMGSDSNMPHLIINGTLLVTTDRRKP